MFYKNEEKKGAMLIVATSLNIWHMSYFMKLKDLDKAEEI